MIILLITYLISILAMSVVQTLQQRFFRSAYFSKDSVYILYLYVFFEYQHIFVFTTINSFSTLKTIYVIYYIQYNFEYPFKRIKQKPT